MKRWTQLKNNNTFHLGVKKLRHSLNILFTCLFEINKNFQEIQALSTDLVIKIKQYFTHTLFVLLKML